MKKIIILILPFMIIISCVPKKDLVYVQPPEEEQLDKNDYVNIKTARKIEALDQLYIKVLSTDQETATILSRETKEQYAFDLELLSYTVDERGFIDFPFIGKLQVQEMTLEEAKTKILEELKEYLSNASVIIKFVNNKLTLLGEFESPGEYYFNNDKITVFSAIGLAGGISDYGDKKNVVLIREDDNRITYHYLDLTSKDIVSSEYYYLLPDDVIIVNPVNAKFWSMTSFNWGTFLTLVTTVLAILYYVDTQP